jgi:hypothetical protein
MNYSYQVSTKIGTKGQRHKGTKFFSFSSVPFFLCASVPEFSLPSVYYRTFFRRLEPAAWSRETGGTRSVASVALADSLADPLQALTEQRPPIIPGSRGNKKCPVANPSVPLSLCACVPVFSFPSVPLSLCDFVPAFSFPSVPLSLCDFVPAFSFPSVPLSLCDSVPIFSFPSVPLCLCAFVPALSVSYTIENRYNSSAARYFR